MSEPVRTRVSGRLSIIGSCEVIVADSANDMVREEEARVAQELAKRAEEERKLRQQQDQLRTKSFAEGAASVEKKYKEKVAQLEGRIKVLSGQLGESLNQYFEQLEEQTKEEIVELSLRITEKILAARLPDHDGVAAIVRQAITPLLDLEEVKIHLNPDTASLVSDVAFGAPVVPDPSLQPGETVIESPQGVIDGRYPARLASLAENLRKPIGADDPDYVQDEPENVDGTVLPEVLLEHSEGAPA